MGIDLLDITFRTEKQFGLKLGRDFWAEVCIPPQEVGVRWKVGTDVPVWRMVEVICERIGAAQTGFESLTRRREEVYRVLHECLNVDRSLIKPEMRLAELIPKDDRAKHWLRLGEALGKRLPELVRPGAADWLIYVAAAGMTFALAGLAVTRIDPPGDTGKSVALFLLVLSVCCVALWFCIPRNCIPRACRTVDHLVQCSTSDNAVLIAIKHAAATRVTLGPPHVWTDEAVYVVLREVLVDALGVDEEEITLDSKLFQDLGCA